MEYISHPWINPNIIEKRIYQENIVANAIKKNTLCVIPTGLGKTSIAALVAAEMLKKDMHRKILFLAPTRPLVNQHKKSFEKFLRMGMEMGVITGEDEQEKRSGLYKKTDIIFSTPQTVRNDLKKNILNLKDFSLVIFDEAHRAVGNYAYTYIAKMYKNQSPDALILALTASPGSHRQKINEVKDMLFIDNIDIRNREDRDVIPYIQKIKHEWITVELPTPLQMIRKYLETIKDERIKKLISWKIIFHNKVSKTQMLRLQNELARKKKGISYAAMSLLAEVLKVDHAIMLLETQCLSALKNYFENVTQDTTKASIRLTQNEHFKNAVRLTNELINERQEHPKISKLITVIKGELAQNKYARIIVFVQFRDTIYKIMESLKEIRHAAPVEFIGQTKKKGKGLSQKKQIQILNEFEMGFYNILVASQVGEEGLDIAETSCVIFYEPTSSAIRRIQRSGRTARTQPGKVIILMTKHTRDEAYHWSGHNKERNMQQVLYTIQQGQKGLDNFKS